MKEKLFISKWLALVACLLLALPVPAQKKDTVFIVKEVHDTLWLPLHSDSCSVPDFTPSATLHSRLAHHYRSRWASLIPTHSKLQFAGNMGLLSIGPGWSYGRHKQWETDLLFGFLPKYRSNKAKATFTLKQNYIPWSLSIRRSRFSVEPLTCGLYLNTVFGDEFWVNEPDRYPKGYYGFSSKIRIHVFLGQRITLGIAPSCRFPAKAISLFYEISTCDLYVISAFTNRYLRPRDYLSLSFGIKAQLL